MDQSNSIPLRDQLLLVTDAYVAATGVALSTLSTKILNGGNRLGDIAAGGDLNTRSFERLMGWFSANWPDDATWPQGVSRPTRVAA